MLLFNKKTLKYFWLIVVFGRDAFLKEIHDKIGNVLHFTELQPQLYIAIELLKCDWSN